MKKYLVDVRVPSVITTISVYARSEKEAARIADKALMNADPSLYEGLLDSFYDEHADIEEVREDDGDWGSKLPKYVAEYGDNDEVVGYSEVSDPAS